MALFVAVTLNYKKNSFVKVFMKTSRACQNVIIFIVSKQYEGFDFDLVCKHFCFKRKK